jgi:hypothetical protein
VWFAPLAIEKSGFSGIQIEYAFSNYSLVEIIDMYTDMNWLNQLKGHQLHLPTNHADGFEFCGARARKGLRIITGASWKLDHYGDVVLDSSKPSSPFDSYLLLNWPSDRGVITDAAMSPNEYFRLTTRGCCSLTILPGIDGVIRLQVDVDGTTLLKI